MVSQVSFENQDGTDEKEGDTNEDSEVGWCPKRNKAISVSSVSTTISKE